MWEKHIKEYSAKNSKDPDRVLGILIKGGWDSNKYDASMKDNLFDYLDDWYTLSIKTLPKPATQVRRNPVGCSHYYIIDRYINEWYLEICDSCGAVVYEEYQPF